MQAYERFLEYVKVQTTSDPANTRQRPSSKRQFDLAEMLVAEMRRLGIESPSVDKHCYVTGWIPATPGYEAAPPLGFIAHLDTAPDTSGKDVRPMLHPNYDGGDVTLEDGSVIRVDIFPELKTLKGQTLITAGGGTLLGADDKAGIAEIMTACEQLLAGDMPHGRLCIAFTPDEEIGEGASDFDVKAFGAKYAYTVDGGTVDEIQYESFNAAAALVHFTGVEVHPGTAKDIMVNAARLASEYDMLLPEKERPQFTEGREGFYHLGHLEASVASARSQYIIRDHDRTAFEARKQTMRDAAAEIERRHGPGCVRVDIKDSYFNMGEVIEQHYHLVENALQAVRAIGLEPRVSPIRGGTDGSILSFMGLPCPDLGTGGHYFHGPNECITVEAMDQAVAVLLEIIRIYADYR